MHRTYRTGAFTLVELLVVVTIIVVLLALLMPAMGRAVYQANLTACAAGNLKSMSTGVIAYAFDNKRFYPDRGMGPRKPREAGKLPINPQTVKRASVNYDIRPIHKGIFPINKTLQCPLSPQVELENEGLTGSDVLDASYAMFWGWQIKDGPTPFEGMFKLGDGFEYSDLLSSGTRINRFKVLAGDLDLVWGGDGGAQASHPDRDPSRMGPVQIEGEFFIDGRINVGRWSMPPGRLDRGLLDTNFVLDDGSVNRYTDVTRVDLVADHPSRDNRMATIPINFDHYNNRGTNRDVMHVPTR